jgi:hypothetical protein
MTDTPLYLSDTRIVRAGFFERSHVRRMLRSESEHRPSLKWSEQGKWTHSLFTITGDIYDVTRVIERIDYWHFCRSTW